MDGTFSIIKKTFMQMWTIHAFIRFGNEKKMVPLCFVLMSSRTQKDYIRVLGHIKTVILGNRYNYKSRVGNRYSKKLFSITIPIPSLFSIFDYRPIML